MRENKWFRLIEGKRRRGRGEWQRKRRDGEEGEIMKGKE